MENRDPSLESELSSRYGNICLVDYRVFLAAGEGTISETLSTSRGSTMAHELGHSLGMSFPLEGADAICNKKQQSITLFCAFFSLFPPPPSCSTGPLTQAYCIRTTL